MRWKIPSCIRSRTKVRHNFGLLRIMFSLSNNKVNFFAEFVHWFFDFCTESIMVLLQLFLTMYKINIFVKVADFEFREDSIIHFWLQFFQMILRVFL